MKEFELSVPKPCHENWDGMTPEDKGRFCAACQKTVIDFSGMSDAQLAQFFKKTQANVCGRFNNDQLERNIAVPKKRLPWISYFFTIALPTFLLSLKASAQKTKPELLKEKAVVCTNQTLGFVDVAYPTSPKKDTVKTSTLLTKFNSKEGRMNVLKTFKSRILNTKGEPVPFATIVAKEEGRVTVSDSLGFFNVKYFMLPLSLDISSIGYKAQTFLYNGETNFDIILQPVDHSTFALGEVVITSVHKKKNTVVPLVQSRKTDLPFAHFSVYPNPISSKGILTIDLKNLEAGKYNLKILSSNGNITQSQTINFEKEKAKQIITLTNLLPGVYFIQLSNTANGKSFTEKIVVQ